MSAADDHRFMARALELAERGAASTDPNPTVGCVVVQDGEIVGEGFTQPAGGPHAEIEALGVAGAKAKGATVYVSLEPCAHTGRTGPCARALVEAGVARVVFAIEDPNPAVAGKGAAILDAAGIATARGPLAAEAERVNRGFFQRMLRQRPFVSCKLAASLDGRTALRNGQSHWITGEVARREVHRFRARSSAVMTGIGTVLADDPALTARSDEPGLAVRQPLRVILDSGFRTPPSAKTLGLDGEVLIFGVDGLARGSGSAGAADSGGAAGVAGSAGSARDAAATARRAALDAAGARTETLAGAPRLDLAAVVTRLAALEINTVWLEAGPTLSGAMLAAGFVDELIVYFAPCLLGHEARALLELPTLKSLDARWRVNVEDLGRVGEDFRLVARVCPRNGRA